MRLVTVLLVIAAAPPPEVPPLRTTRILPRHYISLRLTDEQIRKIARITARLRPPQDELQARLKEEKDAGAREKIQALLDRLKAEETADKDAVLTAEQLKKLKALRKAGKRRGLTGPASPGPGKGRWR